MGKDLNIGSPAPEFSLLNADGVAWNLSDHRGKPVVLLFYPRDNTPVCTKQLCSVRDHWLDYKATGAEIVGISTDSVESHKNFAQKKSFPFNLLSDAKGEVIDLYGAKSWIPGRSARAVVVIDKNGKIAYRKVESISLFRPKDDAVLSAIAQAAH